MNNEKKREATESYLTTMVDLEAGDAGSEEQKETLNDKIINMKP